MFGYDGFFTAASLLQLVPVLMFVLVFGIILAAIVRGLLQWSRNNRAPLQTQDAVVVAKRAHYSGGGSDHSGSTSYYATFETMDGERTEFWLKGSEYGLLAEGDRGRLTRQGTRYKGFERYRSWRGPDGYAYPAGQDEREARYE